MAEFTLREWWTSIFVLLVEPITDIQDGVPLLTTIGISETFHITSDENKISFVFEFRQTKGNGVASVRVIEGLNCGNRIHLLNTQCLIRLDDNEPDPSPWIWRSVELYNRQSHTTIVFRSLPPLPHPLALGPTNEISVYAAECGEGAKDLKKEDKVLKIMERVDFGDCKICIHRVFSLMIPDQDPYIFAFKILRLRNECLASSVGMELLLEVNHFIEIGWEKYPTREDLVKGAVTRRAEEYQVFKLIDIMSIDDPKPLEPAKLV
ncbi:MAG: hypothetical protein M1840_005637 [Geoglossum simile]|nr:MAG: hypothetical protein M1840_005637 [Geoglossum simile]